MDKDHLILTAIGPDQVGLVAKISEFISRHGCNIEDSKMAVFYGEFAIILLISGHGPYLAKVLDHQSVIERESGLKVNIKSPSARKAPTSYENPASCCIAPGSSPRLFPGAASPPHQAADEPGISVPLFLLPRNNPHPRR